MLVGKVGATRLDEVDERKSVLFGDFLGAQRFAECEFVERSSANGRVIARDNTLDAFDDSDAVNVTRTRRKICAVRNDSAEFEKGGVAVDKQFDTLPDHELATVVVALPVALATPVEGLGERRVKCLYLLQRCRLVFNELWRTRVDRIGEHRHAGNSSPRGFGPAFGSLTHCVIGYRYWPINTNVEIVKIIENYRSTSSLSVMTTALASIALQARDITKSFGDTQVLVRASLEVRAGKTVALLGPSGCGKTTLLRILAGLDAPDGGEVTVAGITMAGGGIFVPPERRNIGLVFQDWALFPHMTVAKNVAYGLTPAERTSGRVAETLAMVDLEKLADRMPATLSGGEQQRVALARALAPRPDVLLLDEPFSNLDQDLRVRVRTDVRKLLSDLGISAVFVTHDQEEAFVVGDEVAVMHDGMIEQQATPSELYDAPASAWVASFVGEANLVPGGIVNLAADTLVGSVPVVASAYSEGTVLLRPEYLLLGNGEDGKVADVEFYGHDTAYRVVVDGTELLVRAMAAPRFVPGDTVSVTYSGPPAATFPVKDG